MARLAIRQAVGKGCPNQPRDVKALHRRLMEIGMIPCYVNQGDLDDTVFKGILQVQGHFMKKPDGVISVGKTTHGFLNHWSPKRISSRAQLPGKLRTAWDLVSPLLPEGSYCASGFRSADHQRRILHDFYKRKYRREIVKKYGKDTYDEVAKDLRKNEKRVLAMVRSTGQAIAAPGRSKHQRGKAVDVGGPTRIDKRQVRVIKMVARANPDVLSGFVLKERNGCVHFEIH